MKAIRWKIGIRKMKRGRKKKKEEGDSIKERKKNEYGRKNEG